MKPYLRSPHLFVWEPGGHVWGALRLKCTPRSLLRFLAPITELGSSWFSPCLFSCPMPGTQEVQKTVSRANPASAASPHSRRFFCWRTVLFNVLFQTLSFPPSQLPCLTVCSRDIRVWPGFSALALSQAKGIHFLGLMHQGLPRRG